jgi:hypothetical protein
MCLDHIIAHEICHFFYALPLKLAPTCFIKQCGTSRTHEFECKFVSLVYQLRCLEFGGLQITVGKVLKIPCQRFIILPETPKNYSYKTKKKNM